MSPGDPNLAMLELMAARLGELNERLVFVGGSTTGLFITDPLLPPARVTRDVDVIVEAGSRHDYHLLEEALRQRGFVPDPSPDGRTEIVAEVATCSDHLRLWLQAEFSALLADPMFAEAIVGFLPGDPISQARAPRIQQRIVALAGGRKK